MLQIKPEHGTTAGLFYISSTHTYTDKTMGLYDPNIYAHKYTKVEVHHHTHTHKQTHTNDAMAFTSFQYVVNSTPHVYRINLKKLL